MSFQYGMVARGTIPLAEFSLAQGNQRIVAIQMLENVNPNECQTSMVEQSGHIFFCLTEQDRTSYLCLADSSVNKNIMLNFCEELQRKWRTRYGNNSNTFLANSKDAEFGPEIQKLLSVFNNERSKKISTIRNNIAQAQDQMTKNLSLALARGEQLTIMEEKANTILESTTTFKRESKKVRKRMCFQRYMWYFIGIAIGAVFILVILFIACNPNFSKCKKK